MEEPYPRICHKSRSGCITVFHQINSRCKDYCPWIFVSLVFKVALRYQSLIPWSSTPDVSTNFHIGIVKAFYLKNPNIRFWGLEGDNLQLKIFSYVYGSETSNETWRGDHSLDVTFLPKIFSLLCTSLWEYYTMSIFSSVVNDGKYMIVVPRSFLKMPNVSL